MVGAREALQIGHWDQNPRTDATERELLLRKKVVYGSPANREHLSGFFSPDHELLLRRKGDSSRALSSQLKRIHFLLPCLMTTLLTTDFQHESEATRCPIVIRYRAITLSDLKIFSTLQLSLKRLSGKVVEESNWATRYSLCATYLSQHQQTVHVTARRVEHLQVGALWNWALISGITNRLLQWQRSAVSARLRRNSTSHNRH